jgi:hypothetical protein
MFKVVFKHFGKTHHIKSVPDRISQNDLSENQMVVSCEGKFYLGTKLLRKNETQNKAILSRFKQPSLFDRFVYFVRRKIITR